MEKNEYFFVKLIVIENLCDNLRKENKIYKTNKLREMWSMEKLIYGVNFMQDKII